MALECHQSCQQKTTHNATVNTMTSRPSSKALSKMVTALAGASIAVTALVIAGAPAGNAQAAPTFKAPWTCGVTWHASTYGGHAGNGVDFNNLNDGSDAGKPVLASAAGTATLRSSSGYGNYVDIDHGGGWMTRHAHLADTPNLVDRNPSVAGIQVNVRDQIGVVGGTGGVKPHLHYEQRLNGVGQPVAFDGKAIAVGTTYFGGDPTHTSTNCATTATPPPATTASVAQWAGWIVQWDGDTKAQKTAWLVGPDLTRTWIPDGATYNRLKAAGAPGPKALNSATLNQLADRNGVRAAGDQVGVGWTLTRGMTVTSANGAYRLAFQGDGNLVIYTGSRALWATHQPTATRVVMQADGNLVAYNSASRAVWASGTGGQGRSRLVMQSDGNLVLYRADGRATWTTKTAGGSNQLARPAGYRLV